MEIWKDIENFEGLYQVSNFGNVKSLSREKLNRGKYIQITEDKILKPFKVGSKKKYYYAVDLNGKTKKIHQLVAMAFLNHKPDGTQKLVVDHIDNNAFNNNVNNLQIITNRENTSKDWKGQSSKYTGVSFRKNENKWESYITFGNKKKSLGSYKTEYEAHYAYQSVLLTI